MFTDELFIVLKQIGGFMNDESIELLKQFKQLPNKEKLELLRHLNSAIDHEEKAEIEISKTRNEIFNKEDIVCPHCSERDIIGFGNYRGRKRYRCKACKRTFNDYTGTAVAYIHNLDKWFSYLTEMKDGHPLRYLAKKIGISLFTSFHWRHKVLRAFKSQGYKKLEGISESDETFFLYSEKGNRHVTGRPPRKRGGKARKRGISSEQVAVITTLDRKQNTILEVAGRGRISSENLKSKIGNWMEKDEIVLCTDSHRSYQSFATNYGFEQKRVNVGKRQYLKDKIYHIQTVNSFHSRLKSWMKRFNGVASKYLQHYMDYFRMLDVFVKKDGVSCLLNYSLISSKAFIQANLIKQQNCLT